MDGFRIDERQSDLAKHFIVPLGASRRGYTATLGCRALMAVIFRRNPQSTLMAVIFGRKSLMAVILQTPPLEGRVPFPL